MSGASPLNRLSGWIGASLQRKLVLTIGGLMLLVSTLFLIPISSYYQARLVEEHSRASMQINRLLQAALENAMLKRDIPGLQSILDELGEQADISRVMILNPEMEIRFSTDESLLNTMLDVDITARALHSQTPQTILLHSEQFGEVLRSVNPVENQQPCTVCHGSLTDNPVNGLLVVDYDSQVISADAFGSALKLAALGFLVIMAVSLGIWFALVRLVINPLNAVATGTRALATGDFDTQVTLRGNDEIAQLGAGFNAMSARLRDTLAQLQNSETFLQALIDGIPDGVRVIDTQHTILKANAAYCLQVGQPMNAVVGSKCYVSSHGRRLPCEHTMICCPVVDLCQRGGDRLTTTDTHIDALGNKVFVEVSSARVDMLIDEKTVACVVESIRNLDEQAKISQQQRLSEIGLLAAGVAHEIYNPLSSIDLGLTALQSDLQAHEDPRTLDYFQTIRTEIQNCIKITDSLLLLSAPSSNERTLIALDIVVPEILALLRYEAEQYGVVIHQDLPKKMRILAADSDIRMLGVNLVMNAIHAMPKGGDLHVSLARTDSEIVLEVSDKGVGIAPQDLSNIFMPFWSRRADSSTGRGLGLSIVRAILKRNKARVEVESTLGQGSRFRVYFIDADQEE